MVYRKLALGAGVVLLASGAACVGTRKAIHRFSEIEQAVGLYGTITVGAVRVTPFETPGLKELREAQLAHIKELTKDFIAAPKPEMAAAFARVTELLATLSAVYGGAPTLAAEKPPEASRALLDKLEATMDGLFKSFLEGAVEANRLDLIRLRLGYLRFVEAQIEDLRLQETAPPPNDFHRVTISLQLTAVLRKEEAQGAMVFFDLYPARADVWAHQVGKQIERCRTAGADTREKLAPHVQCCNKDWIKSLKDSAFEHDNAKLPDLNLDHGDPRDGYSLAHDYLRRNRLLPRIVHVEPLDEGELFNSLTLGASIERLGLSLGGKAGQGDGLLRIGFGDSEARGTRAQAVNRLSLAFAAGDARAGWMLMPSSVNEEGPISRPVERRIRMVVDVPRGMSRLSLHAHKMFMDGTFLPAREVPFDLQLRLLNEVRHLLSAAEHDFPELEEGDGRSERKPFQRVTATDFRSDTNWQLMKSRMRNILAQAWSEALYCEIPKNSAPSASAFPKQVCLLENQGENQDLVLTAVLGPGLPPKGLRASLRWHRFEGIPSRQVDVDAAKRVVQMRFPFAITDWLATAEDLRLLIEADPPFSSSEPLEVRYVAKPADRKKDAAKPDFQLIVSTPHVLTGDGTGTLTVRLVPSSKDAKTKAAHVRLRGGDLLEVSSVTSKSARNLIVDANSQYTLKLGNLLVGSDVALEGYVDEGPTTPAVTVRVLPLPIPQEKD